MTRDTIVLVPGLDGTALLFYRQVPLLSERLCVVTFPLPDDPSCTMDGLVAQLDAIVARSEADGRERGVLLCGESFGGALSLSYALAHPGRLKGLVVLNSFARVRQRLQIHLGPTLLRLLPWGAMPLVRRFTESKMHTSHTRDDDLKAFHERSRSIGRLGYIRRLEILRTYDIRDRLSEIDVPTLFLAAEQDRLVRSVEEARFMSERVRKASMKVLPGYGHICLINHDFDLMSTIAPWLESLDGA